MQIVYARAEMTAVASANRWQTPPRVGAIPVGREGLTMSTTKSDDRTLKYVPITGPGVEALERRKEHNSTKIDPVKLRASVDRTKSGVFESLKMLTLGTLKRIQK